MTIEVEVSARRDGEVNCVFCREELTGAIETCPGCGATFHPACRAEMPRCATIGCSGVRGAGGSRPRRRAPRSDTVEPAPAASRPLFPPVRAIDDGSDHLKRARTPEQFMRWGSVGAAIGLGVGLIAAFLVSRHGLDLGAAIVLGGGGLVLGLVEGLVIGAVGVRAEPLLPARGGKNPTIALEALICMPFAVVGEVVNLNFHGTPGVGSLVSFLVVLPFLLRWLGFG